MYSKKIFYIFTLVYFALFAIAGYFIYTQDKKVILNLIDRKLINGANAVPFLLEGYHTRDLSSKTVSPKEDLKNIKKLSAYVEQTDLEYLYSFIIDKDGKVRFSCSSAKKEDLDANKSDIYSFDIYDDPNVKKALAIKKPVFTDTKDKWGEFRSVYIPKISKDGREYVVGADCKMQNVADIFDILKKNSQTVFFLLLAIAALYFALVFYMIRYFNKVVKEKESELQEIYEKDPLTNLYSRIKLLNDLKRYKDAELIILDIYRFKSINSAYGIAFGDRCLIYVAQRLREICDDETLLYKLEADRFCILHPKYEYTHLEAKALKVIKKLEEKKYVYNGYEIYLNFFAGLSSKIEGDNKLLAAEIALKAAKDSHEKICIYTEELKQRYSKEGQKEVIDEIHYAIENDAILTYYQPIYDVHTKKVTKYESLMRMRKRDGSVVAPYHFLYIAQKAQLYPKIASIMFEKVIQKAKANPQIEFSINLSSLDIENAQIRENIFTRLEQEGLCKQITLEILESEDFENYDTLVEFAKRAKSLGIKLSMDDFGSGYSNFSNLAEVHFRYIKIDGSLIKDILENEKYESIVRVIVSIAKQFGSVTIAEFVENEAIAKKLIELGVDKLQGYFIGKPQEELLKEDIKFV